MTERDPRPSAVRPDPTAGGAGEAGEAELPLLADIPFWQRLSTRLTLLILVVVGVLALATTVLVVRGFNSAQQGALSLLQAGEVPADPEQLSAVVRGTLINLVAIFLLTLVGAAVFSRTLLTEPIEQLTRATRELASGKLGVRLPVTSKSELGLLAESFNQMSSAVAESREHLEARVTERTSELQALLALSNTIAVTLELQPLLEQILDRLEPAVGFAGAAVFERTADGSLALLLERGRPPTEAAALAREVVALHPAAPDARDGLLRDGRLALPLVVRERLVGALVLGHPSPQHFSEERRRLARAFAAQVGVAVENVRLYESAQEKAAYDERQHLARELHDSVSQALYAILLGTHSAQRQLHSAPDKAQGALTYVEGLAQAAIAEMRALIFELRPESLEQEGLVGVLRKQLDALETRHGLDTERLLAAEPDIPFATKQVLLRVAQEALHNVVKHAHAERVTLRLQHDAAALTLEVRDDGVGFDPDAQRPAPGHLGLTSMRERLAALGGEVHIESAPGAGVRVRARLPLDRRAAAAPDVPPGGSPDASPGGSGGGATASDPASGPPGERGAGA